MTGIAFCREPLPALARSKLMRWALGGSDRGGQDKAPQGADGRLGVRNSSNSSDSCKHCAAIPRNLHFSATRYCRSTFDTLRAEHDRKRRFSHPSRPNPLDALAADKILPGAGTQSRAEGRRSLAGRPAGATAGLGAAARRALPRRASSTTAPAAPLSKRES